MRLLIDDPNPFNVLEIRELDFCPKNWTTVKLKNNSYRSDITANQIKKWIYNNLSGRFCVVTDLDIIDNKLETITKIGFELSEESTMFNLACSHLHDGEVKVL
jgi:hypothetical protein